MELNKLHQNFIGLYILLLQCHCRACWWSVRSWRWLYHEATGFGARHPYPGTLHHIVLYMYVDKLCFAHSLNVTWSEFMIGFKCYNHVHNDVLGLHVRRGILPLEPVSSPLWDYTFGFNFFSYFFSCTELVSSPFLQLLTLLPWGLFLQPLCPARDKEAD